MKSYSSRFAVAALYRLAPVALAVMLTLGAPGDAGAKSGKGGDTGNHEHRSNRGGDSGSSRQWGYQALYAWVYHIAGVVTTAEKVSYRDGCPGPGYDSGDDSGDDYCLKRPRDASPQFKKAVAAYFWGLPLVEMRRTQQAVLDKFDLAPNDLYNSNLRTTGDSVVAPNLDILNSISFIDFTAFGGPDPKLAGPPAFVLSVPNTRQDNGRGTFTIMQILDAYTNVVGAPGTCVHPCTEGDDIPMRNEGGNYLLSGPTYTGDIPDEFEDVILGEVKIPTAQAWLIGRTQVDAYLSECPITTGQSDDIYEDYVQACGGPTGFDLSAAKSWEFSQKYTLTSLHDFEDGLTTKAKLNPTPDPPGSSQESRGPKDGTCATDPVNFAMFGEEVARPGGVPGVGTAGDGACDPADPTTPTTTPHWTTQNFLEYLGKSVQQNGITEGNKRIFRQFRSLGLTRGGYQPPPPDTEVDNGIYAASQFVGFITKNLGNSGGPTNTNWSINATLGQYDPNPPDWFTATTVAAIGLGANQAKDGIYPLAVKDACGEALDGANDYTLTFSAADQEFPPVNIEDNEDGSSSPLGFWSLTVYKLPEGRIVIDQEVDPESFYGAPVYSLGSIQVENLRGEFVPSEDVTFYFQQESPSLAEERKYWLPVPKGDFEVILRIYAPDMTRFSDCGPRRDPRGPREPRNPGDCYLPPEFVRVTPPVCAEPPGNPDVDRPRIPRRIRRIIDQLDIDIEGDFLSRLR